MGLPRAAQPREDPITPRKNSSDRYANTSSAGSVIAFHLCRDGMVAGDIGVICSFGAGYSIGSQVIRRL